MEAYVNWLLADAANDHVVPFAQRRLSDGELVGCTRYLNVTWWPNRDLPTEVEIGGTWLGATAQRSPINAEAKLLLLTNAFETWGVHRVAICTDALNERSRRAIERIGTTFEGILRTTGARNVVDFYSIIAHEWPAIRADLRKRCGRE